MELSYWQSRWKKENIGWHMDTVYPLLPKLWSQIKVPDNANVLVPLCGKSKDLTWLAEQNCHVTGVEISQKALEHFIEENSCDFTVDSSHGFTIYSSELIELWQGDFLKLPRNSIPTPDLIYDKAAMVALPAQKRAAYADKILNLSNNQTKIFLQTFEYEQNEMNGPPFSVDEKEILEQFGKHFSLSLLHEQSKFEELDQFQRRGLSSYLSEKIYLLESM